MGVSKGTYGFVYGAECPNCHRDGEAVIEHPDKRHILELQCASCAYRFGLEHPFSPWLTIR